MQRPAVPVVWWIEKPGTVDRRFLMRLQRDQKVWEGWKQADSQLQGWQQSEMRASAERRASVALVFLV